MQEKSRMKVNTDSILLGAWVQTGQHHHILDIGTGTGILALMMAQRNPTAQVLALDIDTDACEEASHNAEHSPWADRVVVQLQDVRELQTNALIDLIIANPPYYEHTQLVGGDPSNKARYTSSLSLEDLILKVSNCLSPLGQFNLILPVQSQALLVDIALQNGLYLHRLTLVYPKFGKPAHRVLMSFGMVEQSPQTDEIYIYDALGQYTDAFKAMTQDFYLIF